MAILWRREGDVECAAYAQDASAPSSGRRSTRSGERSMTDGPAVRYEVDDRIARITLDRPERGNGITRGLIDELEQCVERADLDPGVRVMLLSGNGPGFCGGYDLVESAEGVGAMDAAAGSGSGARSPTAGSPLDPAVMAANHDPNATWDPMVDYAMMS